MDSFSNEAGKGCVFLIFAIIICIPISIYNYYHKKNNNIINTNVELQNIMIV